MTVLVNYDDATTDAGRIVLTDNNMTSRAVSIELSAGTVTGTASLSNDCQTLHLNIFGEASTCTQTGNSCIDF